MAQLPNILVYQGHLQIATELGNGERHLLLRQCIHDFSEKYIKISFISLGFEFSFRTFSFKESIRFTSFWSDISATPGQSIPSQEGHTSDLVP